MQDKTLFQRPLLAWYRRHRRDLPWRRTRDPYAIWVSEIMLQQTQVATAIPYYKRFLRRFPDACALARAPLERVLKAWEGLGYYGRARNLRRAAQVLLSEHGGRLPEDSAALRKLPGIGRYTAGAISSIAFDRDEPVLDGNVIRVLCRVFLIRANPKTARTQKRLWKLAGDLLPAGRASIFNQALMDLGATVCLPLHPRCEVCPFSPKHAPGEGEGAVRGRGKACLAPTSVRGAVPVRCRGAACCALSVPHGSAGSFGGLCRAFEEGMQEKLPLRAARKPIPHYDVAVGIIRKGGKILIDRRKPEGLLGGLWEFPGGKRQGGETLEKCLAREVREELGVRVRVLRPLVSVRHAYSHFRVTLHAYDCRWLGGWPRAIACDDWRWVSPAQLSRFAFPAANRRILASVPTVECRR